MRPHGLVALIVAAAAALVATWGPGDRARAASDGTLVAKSVCEAQELKARKAQDPELAIEIPAEFDKPFPTLMACRSHEAAWDPTAPGPNQPIPFSHKHHAGKFGIDCQYCTRAPTARGPPACRRWSSAWAATHSSPPSTTSSRASRS